MGYVPIYQGAFANVVLPVSESDGENPDSRSDSRWGLGGLKRQYRRMRRVLFYDTLMYPFAAARHRSLYREAPRSSTHTFTRFYRVPLQLEALTGPVVENLGVGETLSELRILLFAGSTGAEAYTISSSLRTAHPDLDFRIVASDLHEETVRKARAARYTHDEVFAVSTIPNEFLADTFVSDGAGGYVVRSEVSERVTFEQADLLDESLLDRFAQADIVFAQNVLFHLDPAMAERAFRSVARFMKPRAALFVDGMDLDLKVALTKELGLNPLEYRHRQIYDSARRHIPPAVVGLLLRV